VVPQSMARKAALVMGANRSPAFAGEQKR
jgi:hypothetical protein